MGRVVYRTLVVSTIFLAAFLGGVLPFYVSSRWPRLLSLLNAVAAGVFLAAALVHLLDDAEQNTGLQRWSEVQNGRYAFPWAPAFCLAGFLLLVFVGELARSCARRSVTVASPSPSPPVKKQGGGEVGLNDGLLALRETPMAAAAAVNAVVLAGQSGLTAYAVFAALSVHSVLAGLGLGAAGDSSGSAWGQYIAIMAHKSLASFALGSNFASLPTPPRWRTIVLTIAAFACMTPLGAGIGWLVIDTARKGQQRGDGSRGGDDDSNVDPDGLAIAGVLSAIASGTFLYVATMELLPDALERSRRDAWGHSRLATNLAIGLGAVSFAALARWV